MNGGLRPAVILALALLAVSSVSSVQAVAADSKPLDERLAARGIRDARVLEAFRTVRRDVFVPPTTERVGADGLPTGYGQTISEPYLLARMVELLDLKPNQRVLEIGAGTGYPTAIVAELAQEVFAVEVIPELATTARLRLTHEGYRNVHVKLGDGALGWREYGPYDAVVVTAVGPKVPPALVEQLVEGGVLVMPIGPARGRQVLIRGVRKGFKLHAKEVAEIRPGASNPAPADRRPPRDDVRDDRPPRARDDSQTDR